MAEHDPEQATSGTRDIRTRRKLLAILRALHDADRPLGGARIALELQASGIDLSQRTVRFYLRQADAQGLTENLGRRGRRLTPKGAEEVASGLAVDKVGFIGARVEGLAYRMDFNLSKGCGDVILNVSAFDLKHFRAACKELARVFEAGLGMGRRLAVAPPGAMLGGVRVPDGQVAVATVCSVSLNGVLLKLGIATTSVFGGLLEIQDGRPYRFTHIIHYSGSTVDPLEIFIKGHMTSVREAARTGRGAIGASFREIPTEAVQDARRALARMETIGLGAALLMGRPNQPLLDVPVPQGRTGVIVAGGLNPLAAVEESGTPTRNMALHTLYPFEKLTPYAELIEDPDRVLAQATPSS
jgi:repressor of nif and glnA expression